jgi:hypothetical protein
LSVTYSGEASIVADSTPGVPVAPTITVDTNTGVTINWVSPPNIGSVITAYTLAIQESNGIMFTPYASCVIAIVCTVPITVLQNAPYNLAWGDSVYATVQATNAAGSSSVSAPGNGAPLVTNPDEPNFLANDNAITSSTVIGITWAAPTVVGGTPVIDYQVSWDQGTGAPYAVLASNIGALSYTTTTALTPGKFYNFIVKSRNAFGYSTISSNSIIIKALLRPG